MVATILFIDLSSYWLYVHLCQLSHQVFQYVFIHRYQMLKEPLLFFAFPPSIWKAMAGAGGWVETEFKATLISQPGTVYV